MIDVDDVGYDSQWIVKKIDDFFFAERVSRGMWVLFLIFFWATTLIQMGLIGILSYVDIQMFSSTLIDSQPFGPVVSFGLESLWSTTRAFGVYLAVVVICNFVSWYRDRT
jgi:hypothetical protein